MFYIRCIIIMYVNNFAIYCMMDLRGKKTPQRLFLRVQFFARARRFARVPARVRAITRVSMRSVDVLFALLVSMVWNNSDINCSNKVIVSFIFFYVLRLSRLICINTPPFQCCQSVIIL